MKKEDLVQLQDNLNYMGSILLWYVNNTEEHFKENDEKIADLELLVADLMKNQTEMKAAIDKNDVLIAYLVTKVVNDSQEIDLSDLTN